MVKRAIDEIDVHMVVTTGINGETLKLEKVKHTRPAKNVITDAMRKLRGVCIIQTETHGGRRATGER